MVLNVQSTMTFIWNNRRAKSHCLRPNSVKIVHVFLVIGTSNGYRPQPTRSAHWTKYIYIYITQNNGTGGNDGFECVTLTSVVNLKCVATLTSVVNIMLQRRDAENVTSSPNQWNIYIHSILSGCPKLHKGNTSTGLMTF